MAKQQGRYFRPKPKALQGTQYDSTTEKLLHEGVLKDVPFHASQIKYVTEHTYNPDFTLVTPEATFYIEVKGYFQDRAEASKYNWVKASLGEGEYLVFVFEKPDKPIHFQAKRRDGTKMTHKEWCDKNGFMCFDINTIENLLK